MTKYGLRTRVISLTLAPTLIIGSLLSAYFIGNRYKELDQQVTVTGQAIVESLAVASEIGLGNESYENIRRLIGNAHRQNSELIRSIAVFTSDHQLFVSSNYHRDLAKLALPLNQPIINNLNIARSPESLLFHAPIRAINHAPRSHEDQSIIGYIAVEIDCSKIKLKQYQEITASCVVLIIGLVLAGIFAYRLLLDVEIPIKQMGTMVDRIRRGHLDVRVEGEHLDELDQLKNGINAMAISLSEYHSEMQQSIDQATSDLRETLEQLEIQNVELDIAKKNAQEGARVKTEFLANMSHELRTPLNSVIGFTRQILKTQLSGIQKDYLQTIEKSAKNLLSIINDILDFSKLEVGKLQFENIAFDLEQSLDEVLSLLAPIAHEKGLELNISIAPEIPTNVMGDSLRLQQIMTNLVGNAIKFTDQGQINLFAKLHAANEHNVELQFLVEDTGIGISKSQQSMLFQAFKQADASINRRFGGTGLGLVITQKLIQQMGGDIHFSSKRNQGSCFWFNVTLQRCAQLTPLLPAIAAPYSLAIIEPNVDARQNLRERLQLSGLEVDCFDHSRAIDKAFDFVVVSIPAAKTPLTLAQLQTEASAAIQTNAKVIFFLPTTELNHSESLLAMGVYACLAKPLIIKKLFNVLHNNQAGEPSHQQPRAEKLALRVLAVDDNVANLRLISALLEERVSHVCCAENGRVALNLAKNQLFDLILMDIQMPEMDGINAMKAIRAASLNKQTPIIAVTAHALPAERERLLSLGMNDYLTKPIEEAELDRILLAKNTLANRPLPPTTEATLTAPCAQAPSHNNASFDWQLALQRAAGKGALALEIQQLLCESFADVHYAIEQALEGDDLDLTAIIHKLHGSCAYCGVPQLQRLCAEVETALKQGTAILDLEPELFEILDEMEKIQKEFSVVKEMV